MALFSIGIGVVGSAMPHAARSEERSERAGVQRLEAVQRLAEGDPAEATRAALDALALDPRDAASWELLGDLRQRQERWLEARAAYEQANALDGHRFRPWLQLGRVHRALGLQEEAQAAITRAREIDPDHSDAALVAAELAEERGEFQRARDLYEAVGRKVRGEKRARVLTRLASLQAREGDEKAAASTLRTAASADARNPKGWAEAARALESVGDEDAALSALERKAAIVGEPATWERIGRLHADRDATDQARAAFDKANAAGDRPGAWAGIGRLDLLAGNERAAADAADRALAARHRDEGPEAAAALGALLVDLGRRDDATAVLEPAAKRTGDAEVVDALARLQAGAGQERKAASTCSQVRFGESGASPGPFCSALLAQRQS